MNKLDLLAAFIAVIEENGFAAAAKKLHVSTAAISRKVARLESELKTQLIRRTTRQLSLTEVGDRYYQHAKKVLEDLCQAELAITDSQAMATGILTVTSNRYFAMEHLLPRLSEFMALNPQLRVNLELAERFPDLAQERIDIIFGVSMDGPPELVRKRVADTRYILCCSPSYLEQYDKPQVPSDLNRHRYISHSMRKPDNVLVFKGNKEVRLTPTIWINDSRALCDCAIAGMGIVTLHDYIVADAIKDGYLVELLSEFQMPRQPIYLYYQQSRYLQPKIRRFIDFYTF